LAPYVEYLDRPLFSFWQSVMAYIRVPAAAVQPMKPRWKDWMHCPAEHLSLAVG
jgi:hypothetical protein